MNRSSFSERSSLPPLFQLAVSFALTVAVAAVLLVLGTAVSCQVADPAAIAKPLGIGIMLLTSAAAGFFFSRCPVRWYLVGPLGGILLQLVLLLLSASRQTFAFTFQGSQCLFGMVQVVVRVLHGLPCRLDGFVECGSMFLRCCHSELLAQLFAF